MGKRGNNAAAKAATKKPKVDPALAQVIDSVKKAGHLPEQCSAMLASMLPFSLAIAADERAEFQKRVVTMTEEALVAIKSNMQTATSDEETKLETVKSSMEELVNGVKAAEAAAALKKEAFEAASASQTDAIVAANASKDTFAKLQTDREKCEATLASTQEQKTSLENAFQTHFKAPMEEGQGPHIKELDPFLKTMDLDKSMSQTLPGTCAKSKGDRGSFDHVILEQLEKAIAAKISSLGEIIAAETSAVSSSATVEGEGKADFDAKTELQNQAQAIFEAAQKELNDGDAALVAANTAVDEFRTKLEEATVTCDAVKSKLADFESGPFANFAAFQTKMTVAEVATAGA